MQLASTPDCTLEYREDLVKMFNNTFLSSDGSGKKLILSIENLSDLLLQNLTDKHVRDDIVEDSLCLVGELTNFNDEKCSQMC
jgi:hypothetical protein